MYLFINLFKKSKILKIRKSSIIIFGVFFILFKKGIYKGKKGKKGKTCKKVDIVDDLKWEEQITIIYYFFSEKYFIK